MTRFLFLTDTHLGANPMGYQQQRGYPEKLAELLARLDEYILQAGDIDFVLHGGDLVDECRLDLLRESVLRFKFSVPHYLCLGNHDLTQADAAAKWIEHAPGFFRDQAVHFEIPGESIVHVVPNHWDETDYYWQQVQKPRFAAEQISRIAQVIEQHPTRTHVLCTHSPCFGIAPEQTGFQDPYHEPDRAFRESILALVERYPQIRCVLAGHNHINSLTRVQDTVFVTGSAFTETPFEFKVIQVEGGRVSVRTLNLFAGVRFKATYDFDRSFVQGRPCDRHVDLDLAHTLP
jgi:3',5'-cyclic AMP phosphodiesterase CpdA